MKNDIRYFSMFTGVGGFELGLENAGNQSSISRRWNENTRSPQSLQDDRDKSSNETSTNNLRSIESKICKGSEQCNNSENKQFKWKCVGMSEIDKYASELLKQRFPNVTNYGDCTKIDPNKLPDFDMLCGGFPCQAFSIAGKRRGFDDTRGTMFFEVARILKVKRPKIVFLENVKGLLNHEKGETFKVILQTLDELGYQTQWMVLNSKFFGVPQNRERVFIIGSLRGTSRPEILPFRTSSQETNEQQSGLSFPTVFASQHKIARGMPMIQMDETKGNHQGKRVYSTDGISQTISSQGGGMGAKTGLYIAASRGRNPENPTERIAGNPTEQRLEVNKEGTSNNLSTIQKDNMVVEITSHSPRTNDPSKGGSGPLRSKEHCFTIDRTPHLVNRIRRLTPTECERLQGFPEGWTEGFSDTQRYRMMGNAVTVNVIKAIGEKLCVSNSN